MQIAESIYSPDDNVAKDVLVTVETATTQIKEIIAKGISNNLSQAEITKELNKVIAKTSLMLKSVSEDLSEYVKKSLISSAKKWFYQLNQSYRILQSNFTEKAKASGVYDIGIQELLSNPPNRFFTEVRPILTDGTNPIKPIIADYEKKLKMAIKALATEPPKIIKRKDGVTYQMSARNLAEMTVRYEANMADIERLKAEGVKLVWTSSHPNCSERCMPYQGKLWSLDGSSGSINGISYKPLDIALKGPKGDGNGIISGYNCRHRLVIYHSGSKAPKDFSEKEIKEEYKKDRVQRNYENNIRHMKTEEKLLRASGDTEEAKKLRLRWRRYTRDYQIKSLKMGRAFYPYRYIIDKSELNLE